VLKAAVACSIQSVIYRMPSVHSNLRPLAETPTMIKARNGIRRKAPPNPRPHEFSPPQLSATFVCLLDSDRLGQIS